MQLDRLLKEREEPGTEDRLRKWARAAVAVAVILTVLLSLLSWRAAQQATETADWVDHTHEVITELESALRHSLDVETGGRGFAETGSAPFLEPYESGRQAVVQDLHGLRRLLVTPDELRRLNVLEGQTNNQIEDVEAIVATRQNMGTIPTLALFEQGKHDMDAVRITVEQMEVAERGLLALRTQRAHAAQHSSLVVITLGSLLGVIFLSIAGMKVSREIGVSARARAQVKALNADLERRVEQRTVALQSEVAARQRTEEIRERLAAIVDSSEDAIISKTLDGTISAWNGGAEQVFGYSASEAVGKPILMLLPAERMGEESGILARMKRGERVEHFETVRIRKDGVSIDVSVTISPIRDGDGAIVGASKIARDISGRKRAEEALREKEQLLSESQRIAHIGSWSLDPNDPAGRLVWSDEMYRIYGVSRDTFTPTVEEFLLRIVGEDRSAVRQWIAACAAGEKPGDVEFRLRLPDGAVRLVSRHGELQYDPDGKPIRMTGTSQDITERSLQDEALRKSEAFLEQTGRLAGLGGWDIDLATNTVLWGAETYRILGADPAYRPTLQAALDLYTPEFRPVIAAAIEKAAADGAGWDLEASLIGLDGRCIWARVVGTVEFADGRPVRLVGVFQDITARIAAEQAVEEAQARTALATKSSGIGIWDWDLCSGEFNCDALLYQLFGLQPEVDKFHDLAFWAGRVHPQDRATVQQALQDAIDGIKPYDTEYRNVWDDGSIHHISATGNAIRDPKGVAVRMVGTSMDITARRQAEEALRLSNDNERMLIMGVKDYAILMLDPQGLVTSWNEGAERIKGYRAEEIVGVHFSKFYTAEAITEGKPAGELQIATERGRFEEEGWRVRKDGSRFWANVIITALFDANGKLRGFGKVTRDISQRTAVEAEREKVAAELVRYTRALERSNLELDAFAYAASHDLKAPLRVIQNASMWIEEDLKANLTPEISENMTLLRSRVRRMDRLLDDLLEYSRIGRETDSSPSEAISGAVLMENILGLLSPPEGFLVYATPTFAGIEVSRMPLQQILINLVSNAIKHHDKKAGRIEVSVEDLGSKFRFGVKDDGPGIPPQYHEQVFRMFQTLKPRDQVEGSGMGLAMVRKHVEVAGGELTLESAVGQGSTFSFTWPQTNTQDTKPRFARVEQT